MQWGTAITVDVRDDVDPGLLDEIFIWFDRVDQLFSTWRVDSEMSRLATGELRWHQLSNKNSITSSPACASLTP